MPSHIYCQLKTYDNVIFTEIELVREFVKEGRTKR